MSANAHEYSVRAATAPRTMPSSSSPSTCNGCSNTIAGQLGLRWTAERATMRRRTMPAPRASCRPTRAITSTISISSALIGHVRGIQAKLRQIEADDPPSKPFATHMQHAGRELRSEALHERAGSNAQTMMTSYRCEHAVAIPCWSWTTRRRRSSFLTDTLDQAGFTVLIATDGDSALELVDQITPDLVLMDAVMPGINGFEACRRLKREKLLAASAGHLHDRPERHGARGRGASRRAASTTSPNPS